MDRDTQLFLMSAIIERVRLYPDAAFNRLFEVLDTIEREHDLIPRLSEAEEAEVARFEAKIERGEQIPELEQKFSGPVEDLLPESESSILARLSALPEKERDAIWRLMRQLVDIDEPPERTPLAILADLRQRCKRLDVEKKD